MLDVLVADMRARGRTGDPVPGDPDLGRAMSDEHVRLPQPPHPAG